MARLWQGLAENFVNRGHRVTIVCRSWKGMPERETIRGVQFLRSGGFPQGTNILLDLLKDAVYAIQTVLKLPDADILVTNDFWLPALTPRLNGRAGQVVVSVNRFPKKQMFLYKDTARLAAPSSAVQGAILQQNPSLEPQVCVIPNPIDTTNFFPSEHRKPYQILYVGRLHPEKGVALLVEAFALLKPQHPELSLCIVGPWKENQGGGGKAYLQKLQKIASGFQVEFCEPVFDPQRLAAIYRSAGIFCYPSLADQGEAFGVAPLEAMASGLPVVVSDLMCFKDYLEEGVNGFSFAHRSKEAVSHLATCLMRAMNDAASLRTGAIRTAQRFSYASVADQYLEDFAKILEASNMSKGHHD